jgi:hypothetical protein
MGGQVTANIKTQQNGENDGNGEGDHHFPPRPTGGGSSGGTPAPVVTPVNPPILPLTTQRIADVLKGGSLSTATTATVQSFLQVCMSVASGLGVAWSSVQGTPTLDVAYSIRSSVLNAFARATAVAAEAASRGFLLPDDPSPRFQQINADRKIFEPIVITPAEDKELLTASIDLIKVAAARDAGKVSFLQHRPAAQLASFEVSLDGISRQTGDPLVDILGYQPDADFIKRKQALDSLAKLDFSKRKPYLLFTADVITGGKRQSGTIVCWMKMRDASGYTVSKRDVFSGLDFQSSSVTAALAEAITQRLLATPDFRQILSFYDWVNPGDVVAFADQSSVAGTLYSYSISGIQTRAPANTSFFDTSLSALYLSPAQASQVRSLIVSDTALLASGSDPDSVSPYPAISQVVYGDPGYGWILAGCNVLGSKRRGDSVDETRSLSYIGSKASVVLASAAAGRMFVPNDINLVHTAIDSGVASYGISQTILSVLDGTGVTLFAARKDDPLGFQPTQQSLESVSRGLAKILAVIDPETATLDPHALAVALSTPTNSAQQPRYSPLVVPASSSISVPDGAVLDRAFGSGIIDLTTYSGISRLMQIVRTIYDFYPGALV